jgi:hypothetical protein
MSEDRLYGTEGAEELHFDLEDVLDMDALGDAFDALETKP